MKSKENTPEKEIAAPMPSTTLNRFWKYSLAAIIAAGIGLRFRMMAAYEFKDDQARSLLNALCALRDGFLVWCGQPGSTGIPNPPGGPIVTGVWVLFGQSSLFFAGCFLAGSLATVAAAFWCTRQMAGERMAWFTAALTAASPVLIWNATNAWGPGLLPGLVFVWLYWMWRWRKGDGERFFFGAGMLLSTAAWTFHLSALFLGPAMLWALRGRKWPWRAIVGGIAASAALWSWYLYFMLFRWDRQVAVEHWSCADKLLAWFQNVGATSNGFFLTTYFSKGVFADQFAPYWIMLPVLAAGAAAVWGGVVAALWRRRWTWIIRLSLVSTASVPLLYAACGLKICPHYLMVVLAPFLLLSAWGWRRIPVRCGAPAVLAGAIAMLAATWQVQTQVIRQNGDWYEFGPSGNLLESAAAEIDRLAADRPWMLHIEGTSAEARRKLDPIALLYIFDRHMVQGGEAHRLLISVKPDGTFFYEIQ